VLTGIQTIFFINLYGERVTARKPDISCQRYKGTSTACAPIFLEFLEGKLSCASSRAGRSLAAIWY
jgi:hypothetical protein